ncbi:MAG: hypothetical protein Q8R24_05555, partial [Legionellaceae bacterium]|nr:hypothetical protein [Legionellaceae bacterium]
FCWAAFARRSLGVFNESQLRWMFRYAKIAWDLLLQASVAHLISHYGILDFGQKDMKRAS